MAVRGTMAALILRVRLLINDTLPLGSGQVFVDQDIQDVLDAGRMDLFNEPLKPLPTFSGSTIQYLNYFSDWTDWETDYVLKQYLTITVTPSSTEPITGAFNFSASTLPPVYITGKSFDIYRAAADLLQRWAAKWVLLYSVSVDGQSLQRAQAHRALTDLAKMYRLQQRAVTVSLIRTDAGPVGERASNGLQAKEIDYMASGD
jgi:hypothetical protein